MKPYEIYATIGAALVILISLLYGFSQMLAEAINHLISDLTVEIVVHAYIAGLVLIAYAAYLYKRKRKN